MATGIKCEHCSTQGRPIYHMSVKDVQFCAFSTARTELAARSAKVEPWNAPPRPEAALVIPNTQPVSLVKPQAKPDPWKTAVPRVMVENLAEGRYAACPSGSNMEFDNWTFIRVWKPTSGRRRGQTLIRTQHSDSFRDFITIYPDGRVYFAKTGAKLDQALLMIAADPYTSAMNYAFLKSVCSSCGKKLTDARSRYYGIGPECEKRWPQIINKVNESKGPFHG